MQEIPLESLPNQQLSVTLDGLRYTIVLREGMGQTCNVTILVDDVVVISNVRAMANQEILPYPCLEGEGGNFAFQVDDGESYPYWENFGTVQRLIYASPAELEAIRNG